MKVELGKISHIRFGRGGYDDAMFGLSITFKFQSGGVQEFIGTWDFEPDDNCKWTREDQTKHFADVCRKVAEMLRQTQKKDVYELVGTPVSLTFDGMRLVSWRILDEVL